MMFRRLESTAFHKVYYHISLTLFEDSQQKGQNALQEKSHWSIYGFPIVAAFPYHNPGGDFKDYVCLLNLIEWGFGAWKKCDSNQRKEDISFHGEISSKSPPLTVEGKKLWRDDLQEMMGYLVELKGPGAGTPDGFFALTGCFGVKMSDIVVRILIIWLVYIDSMYVVYYLDTSQINLWGSNVNNKYILYAYNPSPPFHNPAKQKMWQNSFLAHWQISLQITKIEWSLHCSFHFLSQETGSYVYIYTHVLQYLFTL